MLYEEWKEILDEINSAEDLDDKNIVDKIKEKLAVEDSDTYEQWEGSQFNINLSFTLSIGYECTLLHTAAYHNLKNIVNALLAIKDIDINAVDQDGETPLHWTVGSDNADIVKALLKNGANVNAVDNEHKTTPLHMAAENGHIKVVKALLKKEGINIDIKDDLEKTPLHWATENGHIKVVKALLRKGADPFLKDRNDKTPRELAENENMAQLLKKAEERRLLKPIIIKCVTIGFFTAILGTAIIVWRIEKSNIVIEAVSITLAALSSATLVLAVGIIIYRTLTHHINELNTEINEIAIEARPDIEISVYRVL